MARFDIKKFALAILFSLIVITLLSTLLSNYTDIPTLKTGKAFILVFIGVYITLLFSVAHDWKFEKGEIWLLIFVAFALVGTMWALKSYFPEIFSVFPSSTKQLFSTITG